MPKWKLHIKMFYRPLLELLPPGICYAEDTQFSLNDGKSWSLPSNYHCMLTSYLITIHVLCAYKTFFLGYIRTLQPLTYHKTRAKRARAQLIGSQLSQFPSFHSARLLVHLYTVLDLPMHSSIFCVLQCLSLRLTHHNTFSRGTVQRNVVVPSIRIIKTFIACTGGMGYWQWSIRRHLYRIGNRMGDQINQQWLI